MNLYRLSQFSIAACLTGLGLLVILSLYSGREVLDKQAAIDELLQLNERINEFSAASDSLILFGADPGLWNAYHAKGMAIRQELLRLGEQHPEALRAARRVAQLLESVEAVLNVEGVGDAETEPSRPGVDTQPLDVPLRSLIVMHHVAGHGIALDTALDSALRQRKKAIAREASWIGATLAGAALIFGALCVVAFGWIHGRVARPARSLANTLERLRAGETGARATVTGNDELGRLAETLNKTLDDRDAADAQVIEQQKELQDALAKLTDTRDRLVRAQSTANIGSWDLDLATKRIEWSDQMYKIFGLRRDQFDGSVETLFERIHPEDREWLRQRQTEWLNHGGDFNAEHRIVRPDGEIRWVRAQARLTPDKSGRPSSTTGTTQDITEQKMFEHENRRVNDRLANMLEAITDGFVAFDEQWEFIYINAEGARILDKSPGELYGTSLWEHFPELSGSSMERALVTAMEERQAASAEEFFEPLETWFDIRVYPWEDGVAVVFRDVSENHRMIEQLRAQEAALRLSRNKLDAAVNTRQVLINSLPAHIAMLDADGVIITVNDQWRHFGEQNQFDNDSDFGVGSNYITLCESAQGECSEEAGAVADGLREVLQGERESFTLEYPCHAPDEKRWFRVIFNRLSSPGSEAGGAVAMHIDITDREIAEQKLRRLAYEDPLTGLLSRNGFAHRLQETFEQNSWPTGAVVAMLDVVSQHDINEAHGYDTGDRMLFELGQRLQHQAGHSGLAARVGGDEFVVYFPPAPDMTMDEQLGYLEQVTEEPFDPDDSGIEIEIAVRVGYTVLGDEQRRPEDLVHEAELALFENRADPAVQQNWVAFTRELNEQTTERIQLTGELRRALEAEEFELHFQPKVYLEHGGMISAEALIRWQHPERGLLPPGLFIPVAEQSQLIGPIGDWTLREACRQLREWKKADLTAAHLAVNVSQIQFMLGDFPAKVHAALEEFDINPAHLTLEITESVFESHSERLLNDIRALKKLGVRMSLDDFGTGYSSLLYLQRYPFDEIKIDRGFVDRMLDDRYSHNIVRTVLNLAAALNAEPVAEGVESREVADALLEMGCQIGQGFYYSMPLAIEDFRWLLERGSHLPLSSNGHER